MIKYDIFIKNCLISTAFQEGPLSDLFTRFRYRMQIKALGGKPAEASLDWQLIAHTALGPGIETGTHCCKVSEVLLGPLLPQFWGSLQNRTTDRFGQIQLCNSAIVDQHVGPVNRPSSSQSEGQRFEPWPGHTKDLVPTIFLSGARGLNT